MTIDALQINHTAPHLNSWYKIKQNNCSNKTTVTSPHGTSLNDQLPHRTHTCTNIDTQITAHLQYDKLYALRSHLDELPIKVHYRVRHCSPARNN